MVAVEGKAPVPFASTRLAMQQTIAHLWDRMQQAKYEFGQTALDDPKRDVKRTDYESALRQFKENVPLLATAIRALTPIDPEKPAKKKE